MVRWDGSWIYGFRSCFVQLADVPIAIRTQGHVYELTSRADGTITALLVSNWK